MINAMTTPQVRQLRQYARSMLILKTIEISSTPLQSHMTTSYVKALLAVRTYSRLLFLSSSGLRRERCSSRVPAYRRCDCTACQGLGEAASHSLPLRVGRGWCGFLVPELVQPHLFNQEQPWLWARRYGQSWRVSLSVTYPWPTFIQIHDLEHLRLLAISVGYELLSKAPS